MKRIIAAFVVLLSLVPAAYAGTTAPASGGATGGGSTLPFPGIVYGTSATGGTVATSSQVQSVIGSGVYDASGAAAAAQAASDPSSSASTVKSYFTSLTGFLSCNGSGCTAATTIPATSLSGITPIANGGTGAATATSALDNLHGVSGVGAPGYTFYRDPLGNNKTTNVFQLNDPNNMMRFRTCIMNVKSNYSSCTLMIAADSTGFGAYSALPPSQNSGDLNYRSWPTTLARYLKGANIPATAQSWFGSQNVPNDPRITYGNAWAAGGLSSAGGQTWASSTNTNAFCFTPAEPVDTISIYTINQAATTGYTYTLDGGTATAVNLTNSNQQIQTTTLTATRVGTHTACLTETSGTVNIVGMQSYNSTRPSVRILNMGISGATTANFALYPYPYSNPYVLNGSAIPRDVVMVDLTINEWGSADPLATFDSNMAAIINFANQNSGSAVLMTGNPSSVFSTPLATQQTYVNELYKIAANNGNLPVIDIWSRWGGLNTTMATYGFMGDNLHPSYSGYDDIAQGIMDAIGPISRGVSGSEPESPFLNNGSIAKGSGALAIATTGSSNNIAVGTAAAASCTTCSLNVLLGYQTDVPSATSVHALNIDNTITGYGVGGSGTLGYSVAVPWKAPGYSTAVTTITPSATPTLMATNGLQTVTMTSAQNEAPTITGIAAGQRITFEICQPASGTSDTWTWPTSIHGGMTIGTTLNACSVQSFNSFNGTTLIAEGVGITNVAP